MGPTRGGRATDRSREGQGRTPRLAAGRALPSVELLAAGLGLATTCTAASNAARAANDAPLVNEDVRDVKGPESGWRSWFGAVVRETLDSTGTFRT